MRDKGYSVLESRDGGSLEKLSLPAMICIVVLFCAAAVIAAPAQSVYFTNLHSFDGTDGAYLYSGLVQGTDGNFYGTTAGDGPGGYGTVFKITPSGTLTTLYGFEHGEDGGDPEAGLVQGTDGNFYGTTYGGGVGGNCYGGIGCGTVFKITPAGTLTTVYDFGDGSNLGNSTAALVQGSDGNFYGTTVWGGDGDDGAVFKLTPSGTLTTLHSFGGWDGANPGSALVQGSDGNFYGTTPNSGSSGGGTVFKITPSGTLTTLHNFCSQAGCTDGDGPLAPLMQSSDGNFYGTTSSGGTYAFGTVFKITPSGAMTTLYSFGGTDFGNSDGVRPYGGLVQASDGNFYGTTANGGGSNNCISGCGTVFQITLTGILTMLHRFNGTDGVSPFAGLVQARDGTFYGTTSGLAFGPGYGTVFRIGVVHNCPTCRP